MWEKCVLHFVGLKDQERERETREETLKQGFVGATIDLFGAHIFVLCWCLHRFVGLLLAFLGVELPLCFAEVCTSVVQAQLGMLLTIEPRQWNRVGLELIVFLPLCTRGGKGQFYLKMPLTSINSNSFCWTSSVKLLHDATVRTPSDPRDRGLQWVLLGHLGLKLSTQHRNFHDITTLTETLKTWIFDRVYSWNYTIKLLSSWEWDLHLACIRVHFPLRHPVSYSRYPPPWDVEFLNQCPW